MSETAEKRAEPTHSPGPYRTAEWSHRLNGCEIRDYTGLAIGIAYYLGGTERSRINARFFAASWDTAVERDRLLVANAELLAALGAFTTAMDMHLGTAHENAICKADDMARDAIARAKEPLP